MLIIDTSKGTNMPHRVVTTDTECTGKQPMRKANIEAIVAYIESGIKPADEPGGLGVEVEQFITRGNDEPVMYSGERGVDWLLTKLTDVFPERSYGKDGELIGVAREGKTVTLEPGAQVELSSGPYRKICAVQTDFEQFEEQISAILKPEGLQMVPYGYRPRGHAEEIELIPKKRYDFMDAYFDTIGPYGKRMMRCSAATQISIDFYSAEDCVRKLRIASILAPIFTLLCDNTPYFEDEPRTHPLMRADVWHWCDPDRCESVPHATEPNYSLADYAEFVLDTPAILVPNGDDFQPDDRTFGEIYANKAMNNDEVEHALSMLFTDVRIKRYLEIRPADSMPAPYVAAYASLIKGLFYHEQNLETLEAELVGITNTDIAETRTDLAAHGYAGIAYGKPVHETILHLFDLAENGLEDDEKPFLESLRHCAREKTSLADRKAPLQST